MFICNCERNCRWLCEYYIYLYFEISSLSGSVVFSSFLVWTLKQWILRRRPIAHLEVLNWESSMYSSGQSARQDSSSGYSLESDGRRDILSSQSNDRDKESQFDTESVTQGLLFHWHLYRLISWNSVKLPHKFPLTSLWKFVLITLYFRLWIIWVGRAPTKCMNIRISGSL